MDGRSALELYKTYLGEHAAGLPATGLLFPLSLRTNQGDTGVVRTVFCSSSTTDRSSLAESPIVSSVAVTVPGTFTATALLSQVGTDRAVAC